MSLITPSDLREHAETDLSDAALQRIIDAEEADIVRRYGAHAGTNITETVPGDGTANLMLSRPVAAISAISEVAWGTTTVLAANDYRILFGGYVVDRLNTGTNPASGWAPEVTVTYTQVNDTPQRTMLLIALCTLALQYKGVSNERDGSYQVQHVGFATERESLFATYGNSGPGVY